MKKIIAATIIVILLFFGICMLILYFNCQRFNLPPEVPIYPGSILAEKVSGGTDVSPVYEYHYTSTASPTEIVNFYTNSNAQCHRTSGIKAGQVCSGDAKPFGIYSAGIDFESHDLEGLTRYSINILWTRCGGIDEFFEP